MTVKIIFVFKNEMFYCTPLVISMCIILQMENETKLESLFFFFCLSLFCIDYRIVINKHAFLLSSSPVTIALAFNVSALVNASIHKKKKYNCKMHLIHSILENLTLYSSKQKAIQKIVYSRKDNRNINI